MAKSKNRRFIITTEMNINDLVDAIVSNNSQDNDNVKELILQIDREMTDYEFTLDLTKALVKSLIEECKYTDEPFDINELLEK